MDLNGSEPLFWQIASHYEKLIVLGVYKPGEEMPSVREIALENNINPNTVARAMGVLEEKGLVTAIPKKGYFVREASQAKDQRLKALEERIGALLKDGYTPAEIAEVLAMVKGGRG